MRIRFLRNGRELLLVLSVVFLSCAQVYALTLYEDGNTFNITVSNEHYQTIYNATGSVYVFGTSASIEVRAEGYRTERFNIYLYDGATTYSKWITMKDPTVFYSVRDDSGQNVEGASVLSSTMPVFADNFAFDVYVPLEGYSEFTADDVSVDVSGSIVWGEQIQVTNLSDTRLLRISVRRDCLSGDLSNFIYITVPADARIGAYRRSLVRKLEYVILDDKNGKAISEDILKRLKSRLGRLKKRR